MQMIVRLYTTEGCHLCEQAAAMLHYLLHNEEQFRAQFQVLPVEISEDAALVEQFGVRIPVLQIENRELGWPFELNELQEWLHQTNQA